MEECQDFPRDRHGNKREPTENSASPTLTQIRQEQEAIVSQDM